MGLLDDAIREHLELKRRHGASDEEVAQQEAEALGPARRDFPVAAEPEPALPSVPPIEAGLPEVEAADFEAAEIEPTELLAPEDLPPAEIDEPLVPNESEHASAGDPLAEPEAPSEPEPEPDPAGEEPSTESPPATDEAAPVDEEPEGEDVLEETPEFLQDAPEHDRLWFEQKPPRDFDFD